MLPWPLSCLPLKNMFNPCVKTGRNSNIVCWVVTPRSLIIIFYVHLSTYPFTLYKHPYYNLLVSSLLYTIHWFIICLPSDGWEKCICGSLHRLPHADNIYNLKMKAGISSEMVENFYQTKRRHMPEGSNIPSFSFHNFKSQT